MTITSWGAGGGYEKEKKRQVTASAETGWLAEELLRGPINSRTRRNEDEEGSNRLRKERG